MGVIIGQLDVVAAPPTKVETPPDAPPKGTTVGELTRALQATDALRRRRRAD